VVKLRVVLVRSRNPLNIGAAARAMANFGLNDMVVVNPYKKAWRETISAVGAEKLVLSARLAKTVDEAVSDCDFVFGTTTVRDRNLERPIVRLPDAAAFLKKRRAKPRTVAVLFGSEKTGLSAEELEPCHAILTIPTSAQCPSMNLGQAVAVSCYELTRSKKNLGAGRTRSEMDPASSGEVSRVASHLERLFSAIDYLYFLSPDVRAKKIRRTLFGWGLRKPDVALIHGLCRHTLKNVRPARS
jgi:tRNA/rRNA methyltransferase